MFTRLFVTRSGQERLLVPALVAFLLTLAVGFGVASYWSHRASSDEDRAAALASSKQFAAAEAIYVRLLHERPSVPLVLAFLDNHERAIADRIRRRLQGEAYDPIAEHAAGALLTDDALDEVLWRDLPPDITLVARFWRGVEADAVPRHVREQMLAGAKREPPVPWFNHLLAREAQQSGAPMEAAVYYEREGLTFPERAGDMDIALNLWMNAGAWEHVRDRLQDARVFAAAGPLTKYRFAVNERDWKGAALQLWLNWKQRWQGTGLLMSAVSALAWAFVCTRLGKLGERPRFRLPLYIVAFGLGVASVIPTMFLIAVEESRLRLIETGDMVRDILFFVFGVGLREEASKLLLFLPLVPILRKWGDRLDVLVAGAMVGLGFAAEENIDYIAQGAVHSGLARFLTANFLHMAMTGILATALFEFIEDGERHASNFLRTSLFVVGLHGAYDFFLSHEEMGGSFIAMAVFLFLTKPFLEAVDAARRRADKGISLLQAFVLAISVVTGVTFVYASGAMGPQQAAATMLQGLLGIAILLFFFVRELRAM
ncbi:PrsW family intramembrane metalloprotease [Pendulispora brunnea]|uniref:PrsW family intramembrane metalloprotease n=1 Tax=Pendulispora brunnea TaxID=2905690 RepID=A0ABZ2K572_9BACT